MIQTFHFRAYYYFRDSLYDTNAKLSYLSQDFFLSQITNFLLYFAIFFSIPKMLNSKYQIKSEYCI